MARSKWLIIVGGGALIAGGAHALFALVLGVALTNMDIVVLALASIALGFDVMVHAALGER